MGPSRQTQQTRCSSEHRNRFGPHPDRCGALVSQIQTGILQTDTHRRGALASTKTDLDPSGRHNRRDALASTKHIGILQTDTQTGALASTETD